MQILSNLNSLDNILDGETRKIPTKNSDLSNDIGYITNSNYATSSTGGVIKIKPDAYGINLTGSGEIYPRQVNYSDYTNKGGNYVIAKGTLEAVITGKNLETANNKVTSISSSSTDTQYPSAKCVYDLVGNLETILTTLDIGSGV